MELGTRDELLVYPPSIEDALQIQEKWKNDYVSNLNHIHNISLEDIKIITGVDISYSFKKPDYGICCVVLWDFKMKKKLDHYILEGEIKFPYKPGLLAFRESFLISQTLKRLPKTPDLIMFDGFGYCHPKRFGEAIHIGYALEIPSIGIAKSMFIGSFNKEDLKMIKNQKFKRGYRTRIYDNNELIGFLSFLSNYNKPVFVSSGYRTDLETAFKIAMETTINYRLPEPLYIADRISRDEIKKFENEITP